MRALDGSDGEFRTLVGCQQLGFLYRGDRLMAGDRGQPPQCTCGHVVSPRSMRDAGAENQGLDIRGTRREVAIQGTDREAILAADGLQLREGESGPGEAGVGAE